MAVAAGGCCADAAPAELHVFEEGGHGFGLRGAEGLPARLWPDLLLAWLRRRGVIPTSA